MGRKTIPILVVLLLLCACTRTVYVPQQVDVPVPVYCPAPAVPPFQSYVVHDPQAPPGKVLSGLVATLWEAESQNKQLRSILSACQKHK